MEVKLKKAKQEQAAKLKAEQEQAAKLKAKQEQAAKLKAAQEQAAKLKAAQEQAAKLKAAQEQAAKLKAEYKKYADDSSDEEEEGNIYDQKPTIDKYDEEVSKLEVIDLHDSLKCIGNNKAQKVMNYFLKLKKSEPGIVTPSTAKTISKSKKVKEFLEDKKALKLSEEEGDIHNALLEVFGQCGRGTTEHDFIKKVEQQWAKDKAAILDNSVTNQIDFKLSLIFQDFGIRLLVSQPVTKLYFSTKKRMFVDTPNLPNFFTVKELLAQSIQDTSNHMKISDNDYKTILQSQAFKTLESVLTRDMRKIFSVNKLIKEFKDLATEMQEYIPENNEDNSIAKSVKERHLKTLVDFITTKAKSKSGYISIAAKLKQQIIDEISGKKYANYSQEAIEAVREAYLILNKNQTEGDLLTIANKQFKIKIKGQEELEENEEDQDNDSSALSTELITEFEQQIQKSQKEIDRFTLPYIIKITPEDVSLNHQYDGFKHLCVYLRLMNCSIKRFVKNIKEEDFDGAEFSRGWSFDNKKPFAVIENVSLSAKKSLSQMVQYPSQSSYNFLYGKLQSFLEQNEEMDGKVAATCIKQILKTGSIATEDVVISKSFENFLTIFTYHLFGTEVQRHPGAAIHHAMALDLVINGQRDWQWIVNHLPMAIEKACPAVRCLQGTLRQYLKKPYYYNSQGEALTTEEVELQEFIIREQELANEWFDLKDVKEDGVTDNTLDELGKLCEDFFSINVMVIGDQ